MDFVLGVDVGGTKVRVGIGTELGGLVAESTWPTANGTLTDLGEQIRDMCSELAAEINILPRHIRAAGIGLPGIYDPSRDILWEANNLPGLNGKGVRTTLQEILSLPLCVENDANLTVIAEHAVGAARGHPDFATVAIGTGVGVGLMIDGSMRRGSHGAAGEIQRMRRNTDPLTLQPTSETESLERRISGPGLTDRLNAQLRAGRVSSLSRDATPTELFSAAASGDELALSLTGEEALGVAQVIAWLTCVVDPELIVLTGGVGSNAFFIDFVRDRLKFFLTGGPELVISPLGDRAGVIGALVVGGRCAEREARSRH